MHNTKLRRDIGVFGATMMGLGSILGTGIFVTIGVAAGIAGPSVIIAIFLAALLAICNALSSAQLAASHPVSGGTYEYGYVYLNSYFGFLAGWMFLFAKSASAATAALGFSGYFLHLLDLQATMLHVPIAASAVIFITCIVLGGIKRSNTTNLVIVTITLFALIVFIVAGIPALLKAGAANWIPFSAGEVSESSGFTYGLLESTALMFVAYTGYGRIATLGEEVQDPAKTIPRAILLTVTISATLYLMVGIVCIGVVGSETLSKMTIADAAPLERVSQVFSVPGVPFLIAIGAITAMLGVLINLILGLSRVLLAMARRHDMPKMFSKIDKKSETPARSVVAVGFLVLILTLIGNVKITWSFSAFTVLVYYALTNLAALRLPSAARIYPPIFAMGGLFMCIFLSFWVEWKIWVTGLGILLVGLVWHLVFQQIKLRKSTG